MNIDSGFLSIAKASIILLTVSIHQAIHDHTALRATINIISFNSDRNLLNIF